MKPRKKTSIVRKMFRLKRQKSKEQQKDDATQKQLDKHKPR